MAKADKEVKSKKADKGEKATEAKEFKFGVADLAEKMDLEPATVRVRLRNAGVKKAGKSYGWDSKSDLNEVIEELKEAEGKAAKKKSKADADEKPAKKSKKADKDEKPAKKDKKASKKSK